MPDKIEVAGLKKIDLIAQLMEEHGLSGDELEESIRNLVRKTWWAGYRAGQSDIK